MAANVSVIGCLSVEDALEFCVVSNNWCRLVLVQRLVHTTKMVLSRNAHYW